MVAAVSPATAAGRPPSALSPPADLPPVLSPVQRSAVIPAAARLTVAGTFVEGTSGAIRHSNAHNPTPTRPNSAPVPTAGNTGAARRPVTTNRTVAWSAIRAAQTTRGGTLMLYWCGWVATDTTVATASAASTARPAHRSRSLMAELYLYRVRLVNGHCRRRDSAARRGPGGGRSWPASGP